MKLFLSTLCLGGAAAAASTGAEQKSATPLAPVADAIEVAQTPSRAASDPLLASTAPQDDDDDERELARAADDLEKELAKLRAELAEMRAKLGNEPKGISVNEEHRRRLTELARTSERAAAERAKAEAEIARTKARADAERAQQRAGRLQAEARVAERAKRRSDQVRLDAAVRDREEIERVLVELKEGGPGAVIRRRAGDARRHADEAEAKRRAVESEVARVRDAQERAHVWLQRAQDSTAAVNAKKQAIDEARETLRVHVERDEGNGGPGRVQDAVGVWSERVRPGGTVRWVTSKGVPIHRTQDAPRPARAPQAPPAPQGGGQTIHINVEEGDVHIHSNGAQIHTSKSSSGGGKSEDVTLFGRTTGKEIKASGSNPIFEKVEGGSNPRGFQFRFSTDDEDGHEHEHEIHEEHEHEHEAHEAHEHGVTMRTLPKGSFAFGVGSGSGHEGALNVEFESIEDLESAFAELDFEANFGEIAELDVEIESIEDLFAEPIELETIHEFRTQLPELGVIGKVLERGDVELEYVDGAEVESKVILIGSDGGEPRTMIFRNGQLIEGAMLKGVDVPMLKSIPMIKRYLEVEEIEEIEETEEIEEVEEEPGSVVYLKQLEDYSGSGSTLGVDIRPGTRVDYTGLSLPPNGLAGGAAHADDDLIQLAREIRDELRAMRAELSALRAEISGAGGHSSSLRVPRTPGPTAPRAPRAPRQPRAPWATSGFPGPSAPDAPAPSGAPGTGAGSFPGPTPPSAPNAPKPRTGAGALSGAFAPSAPQPAPAPSPFGLGSGRR